MGCEHHFPLCPEMLGCGCDAERVCGCQVSKSRMMNAGTPLAPHAKDPSPDARNWDVTGMTNFGAPEAP